MDVVLKDVLDKRERITKIYKNRCLETRRREIRFCVIEYICSYPGLDPYAMAAEISREGVKILYDDSSITWKENKAKERKVKKLLE